MDKEFLPDNRYLKICIILSLIILVSREGIGQNVHSFKYKIGKTNNWFNQISDNMNKGQSKKMSLVVNSNKNVTCQIKSYKKNKSTISIYGTIDTLIQADFYLIISSKKVEGGILFRSTKKAIKYFSDELQDAYLSDCSLGELICLDYEQPVESSIGKPDSTAMPNGKVPLLQSFPQGSGCIFLDFDGYKVENSYWNNGISFEAASSGMSTKAMTEAWNLVKEDYSPFNINITTDENIFNKYKPGNRQRVVITPTNFFAPNYGGIAYVGSFSWEDEQPCWAFITNNSRFTGEIISHEAGHTLGLLHDGRTTPAEEYFHGDSLWAPIMGTAYYSIYSQWSKGEYQNANNKEDDILKIAQAGLSPVGFRPDDYPEQSAEEGKLYFDQNGNVDSKGVIGYQDQDLFKFYSSGGALQVQVNATQMFPDLDVKLDLLDSNFNVVRCSGVSNVSGSSLTAQIGAGTFFLAIAGKGKNSPLSNGYSTYGSLGQYRISGKVPVPVICYSRGDTTINGYIDFVSIGSIIQVSGDNNGYGDYTNVSTSLEQGQKYSLYLQPSFKTEVTPLEWAVWIDFNQDKVMNDAEKMLSFSSSDDLMHGYSLLIPDTVKAGSVTMRISLAEGQTPLACENFRFGEVEEYKLILQNSYNPITQTKDNSNYMFAIYPNPARDFITLNESWNEELKTIDIISLLGEVQKTIQLNENENRIDVSDLNAGEYIIAVEQNKKIVRSRFSKF